MTPTSASSSHSPSIADLPADLQGLDTQNIRILGVNFRIPKTKDGYFILWRCVSNCGKCCVNVHHLALLPRDVEALAKLDDVTPEEFLIQSTVPTPIKKLKGRVMPCLKEPFGGERCPRLNKSLKCLIYEQRPHPCRTYPFGYFEDEKQDGKVLCGYVDTHIRSCPGFSLSRDISPMIPILVKLAGEVNLSLGRETPTE